MTETLIVDRDRPGVVVLQLNRPKQLNAINEVMRDELTQTSHCASPATSGSARRWQPSETAPVFSADPEWAEQLIPRGEV